MRVLGCAVLAGAVLGTLLAWWAWQKEEEETWRLPETDEEGLFLPPPV